MDGYEKTNLTRGNAVNGNVWEGWEIQNVSSLMGRLYTCCFHWLQAGRSITELVSLKQNKFAEWQQGASMQKMPPHWLDNNKRRRNESMWVVEWLVCLVCKEFLCDNKVVPLGDKSVSEADETRSKCPFQSRQTFTFHTLQNKSDPAPQIHRNPSQSSPALSLTSPPVSIEERRHSNRMCKCHP